MLRTKPIQVKTLITKYINQARVYFGYDKTIIEKILKYIRAISQREPIIQQGINVRISLRSDSPCIKLYCFDSFFRVIEFRELLVFYLGEANTGYRNEYMLRFKTTTYLLKLAREKNIPIDRINIRIYSSNGEKITLTIFDQDVFRDYLPLKELINVVSI